MSKFLISQFYEFSIGFWEKCKISRYKNSATDSPDKKYLAD